MKYETKLVFAEEPEQKFHLIDDTREGVVGRIQAIATAYNNSSRFCKPYIFENGNWVFVGKE